MKNPFSVMADAFHAQEMQVNAPSGHAGYNLHAKTMKPTGLTGQSPAQHAAVEKAATASVAKRKAGAALKGVL